MKAKERSSCSGVFVLSTLLLTSLSNGYGQTQINLATQGRNVDFTNAPYTKPIRSGASLPSTCSVNEFFLNTSATPGQNLFACLGASWVVMAAQTGVVDPGTNGLIKRTGTNSAIAIAAPNGTIVGTTDTQTLTGKSIDASELNSGVLAPSRLPALTGDIVSPAGSNATSLATVLQTPGTFGDANHSLQVTVDSKGRVTSLSALPIASGSGSSTNAVSSLSAGTLSAVPSTCSAGALYLATDQPLGQQIYSCSTTNSWAPSMALGSSGALAFSNGALDIVSSVVPRLAAANHFTGSNQLDGTTTFANVNVTGTCTGCNASGFSNPMTALGDQIVGGTNGAPTRATVGSVGQIWTVGSTGQPVWASPTVATVAPSTGYASMTQNGNQTIVINNSAADYRSLEIDGNGGGGININYNLSASAPGSYDMVDFWEGNGAASHFGRYIYGVGQFYLFDGTTKTFSTDFGFRLNTTGTQPTCDAAHRAEFWFVQAAAGSEDGLQVCHQTASGFAWKVVF